jgi:hypothetical protein
LSKYDPSNTQTLSRFYKSLMQQEEDRFALNKVREALGLGCDKECPQEDIVTSDGIIKALQARVEMADALLAAFGSLKALSSADARGEVAGLAGDFGGALDAVVHDASLGVALPVIVGEFAQWQQSQNLAETIQLLDKALDAVANKVFIPEAEEYGRLADRKEGTMKSLLAVLVKDNNGLHRPAGPESSLDLWTTPHNVHPAFARCAPRADPTPGKEIDAALKERGTRHGSSVVALGSSLPCRSRRRVSTPERRKDRA